MAISKITALKLVGLVIGCAAKFTTGSLFVFNVYQDAIKDTFNYTQKEVELLSSMLNIGLGVGFLPGMFYDKFGPQWASAVGLVVSVSAYMLIWSSTKFVNFYSGNSWLMAIYFFVCGLGSVFTYMVALNTNIINFDKKHTGKIVGLLNAFFAGSPSVYAVVYYHVFTHGDTTDISNQNFPGFMLLFAISFGIVDILCILFMKIRHDNSIAFVRFDEAESNSERKQNDILTSTDSGGTHEVFCFARRNGRQSIIGDINGDVSTESYAVTDNLAERHMSLGEILLNLDYQLFTWMVALASVIGLVYANNITVISKSLHLDQYNDRITIIIPVTNAIISAAVGLFSDIFKDRFPRMWILMFGSICFTLSQILILFFAQILGLLVVSAILVGFGVAILWSMSPTIMKEMFYVGNLGRNWGIVLLVASLIDFGVQEAYGAIYDSEISGGDAVHCYGMKCIRGGTAICIACGSMSIVLGIVMQVKKTYCKTHVKRILHPK